MACASSCQQLCSLLPSALNKISPGRLNPPTHHLPLPRHPQSCDLQSHHSLCPLTLLPPPPPTPTHPTITLVHAGLYGNVAPVTVQNLVATVQSGSFSLQQDQSTPPPLTSAHFLTAADLSWFAAPSTPLPHTCRSVRQCSPRDCSKLGSDGSVWFLQRLCVQQDQPRGVHSARQTGQQEDGGRGATTR
mgnify:FL=1